MSHGNRSQPAGAIADTAIVSRGSSVLTAQVDGEIVIIEQGLYLGLDKIGSDI